MPLTTEELAALHDIVASGEDGVSRKEDLFEVARMRFRLPTAPGII
jgi:hypothetical protein